MVFSEIAQYFQYNSPLILTYFFISAGALVLNRLTGGLSNALVFSSYRSSLLNPMTYVRLVTHIFGHVDTVHFIGNFSVILLVGPLLEEKFGTNDLLIMILIVAVVTGLVCRLILRDKCILGASGVVYMLIMMSSFVNVVQYKIPLTLILVFFCYVGKEIADSLSKKDNIGHSVHILGAVLGCIFGFAYTYQMF